MKVRISGGRVFDTNSRSFTEKDLFFSDGVICAPCDADANIDVSGSLIIPGLIDIHTHGRLGTDIMTADKDALSRLSVSYAESGATTVFPTVMTAELQNIKEAIKRIKAAETNGADFAGIHIEGPYISEKRPGCHDISFIRKPSFEGMTDLTELVYPLRTHFTIAPEKAPDGLISLMSKISSIGIGHSDADCDKCKEALMQGARIFTHTYNAMSPLSHRMPGCVGTALSADCYAEFICDGIHVYPDAIRAAYFAKRYFGDKFILITDSVPQAGLPFGDYEMNGIPFTLSEDGARKDDGTIVGSVLSLPSAVRNLSSFCDISLGEALICATKTPAEAMRLHDRGSLDIGKRADIVICDEKLNVNSVFAHGKKIK